MAWKDRELDKDLYTKWRNMVLKRDKRRCQMPGCGKGGRVQVHHIQKWSSCPSLRYEVDNGLTLCVKCHKDIKDKEDYFIVLFMQIVESKKK